jgi:hypothetical protein
MMAIQLAWPILLAVLAGSVREHRILVAGLAIAVALSVFVGIALLLGIAVTGVIVRRFGRGENRPGRTFVLAMLGLAAVAVARSVISRDIADHAREAAIGVLVARFRSSVLGLPLVFLVFTWATGGFLVGGTVARLRERASLADWLDRCALAAATLAGLVILVWALDARNWRLALDYRAWLQFASVPVFGMALLDALFAARIAPARPAAPVEPARPAPREPSRQWIALVQASVTLAVLATMALSWHGLTNRLDQALASEPTGCVPTASLAWTRSTALDHWSLTVQALILEGRQPRHIVEPSCSVDFGKTVHITPWTTRRYSGGWFTFAELRAALASSP